MDVQKAIKSVRNVNDYIILSHDVENKYKTLQIPLNMSTVLALKKICSFEVEYFNKCQETGAAFMIMDRMLKLPPSKTWGLLSKELVSLLHYWNEALRKHLITQNSHWWLFLKVLLKFTNEIRLKDMSISNLLVEENVESLLDMATSDRLELMQRMEVIKCINLCCITSSREVRHAHSQKFSGYFTKLSETMSSCGHFPTQLAILELLLRWLLRRHEATARKTAAALWFPNTLYSEECVRIFKESNFRDFFKDARNFLNAHNRRDDSITSVICRRLTVGNVIIISEKERVTTWLDINSGRRSLTVVIDPRLLHPLGQHTLMTHEVFTITEEDTRLATLYRESMQVTISLTTVNGPRYLNESTAAIFDDERHNINICISTRSDMRIVDSALRRAFGDIYQCSLDTSKAFGSTSLSPQDNTEDGRNFSCSEDEARFSNSYQVPAPKAQLNQKKHRRSGFITKSRKVSAWNSPSTTSTTSLAQLHDKLAALPRLRYDKEPLSVIAPPDLSCVVELSEPDENSFNTSTSTFKIRPYGVAQKSRPKIPRKSKTSPSDNEELMLKKCISSEHFDAEKSTSCLFLATIGSNDESVVNETLERIKDKETDLVNLLVNEAFVNKEKDFLDSGINTGDNGKRTQNDEVNSEAIENTPIQEEIKKKVAKSNTKEKVPCTVLSKTTSEESNLELIKETAKPNPISTSDESNTEVITETPRNFVSVRRKQLGGRKDFGKVTKDNGLKNEAIKNRRPSYSIDDIEDFFSQHFKENKDGELIISPTLARKVNQSSSETSESFDKYLISNVDQDFNPQGEVEIDVDVIDCLNDMVNKVCDEFAKCTDYFDRQIASDLIYDSKSNDQAKEITGNKKLKENAKQTMTATPKGKKRSTIKLNYKKTVPSKDKVAKKIVTKKLRMESLNKISECEKNINEEAPVEKRSPVSTEEVHEIKSDTDTSLITRRKRKLYSPKDDEPEKEESTALPNVESPLDAIKHQSKYTTPKLKSKLQTSNVESPLDAIKHKSKYTTPKLERKIQTPQSAAASYKDIEEDRQKFIRLPRKRKSKVTNGPPFVSPRTLKNNDIFDHLKDHVEDNDVKLIDKKSSEHDIAAFNYTSDSEDEDFKKKIDLRGRKSTTTLGSNETTSSRLGRVINKVNYKESKNSSTDDGTKIKKETRYRRKTTKRQNTRGKGRKPKIDVPRDLVDERMREANQQENIISPIKEQPSENNIDVPIEPNLNIRPFMEAIPEDKFEENIPDKRNVTKKVNEQILTIKKEKSSKTRNHDDDINKQQGYSSESPLPALIIEAAPKRTEADNQSTTSSNLIKKCNKLIEDGDDFNNDTTQNLLSDNDRINYSPELQDIPVEIEINEKLDVNNDITENDIDTVILDDIVLENYRRRKTRERKLHGKSEKHKAKDEEIEIADSPSHVTSDKSILTVGKYPITGHGDDNEVPPCPATLKENIPPRNMELEGMSCSMQDYFLQLSTVIDDKPNNKVKRTHKNENLVSPKEDNVLFTKRKDISRSSPVLSLTRLTEDDFRKWLPSPKSSNPDLDYKAKTTTMGSSGNQSTNTTHKSNSHSHNNLVDIETDINKENSKPTRNTRPKRTNKINKSNNVNKKQDKEFVLEDNEKGSYTQTRKRKSMISPINFDLIDNEVAIDLSENVNIATPDIANVSPVQSFKDTVQTKRCLRSNSKELNKEKVCDVNIGERMIESSAKKRKLELIDDVEVLSASASAQSLQSVNKWFATESSTKSTVDDIHFACRDSIQSVLEKLDTTLVEIQRNTSKKFVHMFVDIQQCQKQLEVKRTELFKSTVRDLLKGIMQTVDTKFMELNDRCDELNNEFKQDLKRRAAELIREDCKQKRVMVAILREDVEAAMRQINKKIQ